MPSRDRRTKVGGLVRRAPLVRPPPRGDDGRQIVQLWSGDMDLDAQLAARRDTFVRIDTFEHRVSVWAWPDRLGRRGLAELVLDSYRIRGGTRRAGPSTG